jgi:hypothetical protein
MDQQKRQHMHAAKTGLPSGRRNPQKAHSPSAGTTTALSGAMPPLVPHTTTTWLPPQQTENSHHIPFSQKTQILKHQ